MKKIILSSLIIFCFLGVSIAEAIEYGGLGIFPNLSEVNVKNPLTKAWFIYTLNPGELKEGKVDITNTSNDIVTVSVYPVDAVTTADGAFAPEPEDKEKVGVGTWITLSEEVITLAPREQKTLDFTIDVPEKVDVGDHMGAFIVQGKGVTNNIETSGLRITTRVGARIYITIPGDIVKELLFDEFTVKKTDELVTFYTTFINKGNVRVRLKGNIEITNSSGAEIAFVAIPEREVFPSKTITIPIEWTPGKMYRGKLNAKAIVVYDGDQSLARELTFSVASLKQYLALAVAPSLGVGVGIGLGIVIILVSVFYITRRREMRP